MLAWSQRSCRASFLFAAVGTSQSIEEVGVDQPWPEWECVRFQDHAVAGIQGHAVAEAPTSVACALLYVCVLNHLLENVAQGSCAHQTVHYL